MCDAISENFNIRIALHSLVMTKFFLEMPVIIKNRFYGKRLFAILDNYFRKGAQPIGKRNKSVS